MKPRYRTVGGARPSRARRGRGDSARWRRSSGRMTAFGLGTLRGPFFAIGDEECSNGRHRFGRHTDGRSPANCVRSRLPAVFDGATRMTKSPPAPIARAAVLAAPDTASKLRAKGSTGARGRGPDPPRRRSGQAGMLVATREHVGFALRTGGGSPRAQLLCTPTSRSSRGIRDGGGIRSAASGGLALAAETAQDLGAGF